MSAENKEVAYGPLGQYIGCCLTQSYTNFTAQHPDYMDGVSSARPLFIKELDKELIMPHMKRHINGTQTPEAYY